MRTPAGFYPLDVRRVSQGDDYAPGQDRMTVRTLVDEYLVCRSGIRSIRQLRCHAVPLLADMGDRRAVRVTSSDVAAYVAAREVLGRARSTINRELELLRAAYRHAADRNPRRISPSKVPTFEIPDRRAIRQNRGASREPGTVADRAERYRTGWTRPTRRLARSGVRALGRVDPAGTGDLYEVDLPRVEPRV